MDIKALLYVLDAAGIASQLADGYTTYVGLYVKKVATEGNSSASWITSNKYRCIFFKAALAGVLPLFTWAIYSSRIGYGSAGAGWAIGVNLFGAALAIATSLPDAIHNYLLNKAAK